MTTLLTSWLAFVAQERDVAMLQVFSSRPGMVGAVVQGDIRSATEYLKTQPSPDVLLVEVPSQAEAPALLDALAEWCDPNTKVITVGNVNEYSFYCWLQEIGIEQYLLLPLSEAVLESAFAKLQVASASSADQHHCTVVAVMGARGGVGATTLSMNLAGLLGDITHKKVALVDADPQDGSIALALDIQPSTGLREALEKPDRIDALFLERVMIKLGKYLSVLSAEELLSEPLVVREEAADFLLKEMRAKYDYVVLDISRHMSGFSRRILQQADHTILVSELNLSSLRDVLRIQDMMRDAWKVKPPLVLANKVGMAPKQEVPLADFEKGIGAKIVEQISFAPDVFMAVSQDIPALKHKQHQHTKALRHLVSLIAPDVVSATVPAKNKSIMNLFSKKR